MTELRAAFGELLVSPTKLAQCANAASLTELLALLKQWWRLEHLNDQQLIGELNACNRLPLDLDPEMLAPHWLPWRYHAKTQTVSWCLPQGRPTEPFFDQFIERCRQLPVNQFLQPKTALKQPLGNTGRQQVPAGFIFHVSRCGSTLVSGCLAELQHTHVLSESPLLTEALLDYDRNAGERQRLLQTLMNLQTRRLPESSAVIVKWNAWDIFQWPLIHALYPRVPVLLLIRDPVEVLASHQRLAGRHMAGDPSLAGLHPAFARMCANESPLDFRVRVLQALLEAMNGICEAPGVMTVDYAQLDTEKIRAIGVHFGITLSREDDARIQQRMRFHSKELHRAFQPDSRQKQRQLDIPERDRIQQKLAPSYRRLLAYTSTPIKEAVAC